MKRLFLLIICLLIFGCQSTKKNILDSFKQYDSYTVSVQLKNETKNEKLIDYIYKNGKQNNSQGQCGIVILKEDFRLSLIEPLIVVYSSNSSENYSIELDQIKEYILFNSYSTKNFGNISRFDNLILNALKDIDLNKDVILLSNIGNNRVLSIKEETKKEIMIKITSGFDYFEQNDSLFKSISIDLWFDEKDELEIVKFKFTYDNQDEYLLSLQISNINASAVELGCLN